MIDYKEANKLVMELHKNSKVTSTMDAGNKFIISLVPNNLKKGEFVLDGFFSVDKKTGKVNEYSPVMDTEEFKRAMKNVVYKG